MKTQVVSYSELESYRQCPHKHLLEYKQRWTKPTTSAALLRGTDWHEVLESHYSGVRPVANVIEDIADEERRELIQWMYDGYVSHYGTDPAWRILGVEKRAEFWLPTPRGGRSRFKLKMKLDLVILWVNKLWVVDHKSGKDLPSDKMLDFDDQFGLYTWGMRKLGHNVFGSLHNAARTHRNVAKEQTLESRFARKPLYRTNDELDQIALDAYHTARHAYGDDIGERNTDTDRCRWRCSFTESCLTGRKRGADKELDFMRSAGFVQDFERH